MPMYLAKYKFSLSVACLLACTLFVRVYKLDQIPEGFYVDEIVNGYEAYSIKETGRDMNNRLLPMYTQRFETANMEALFIYSCIPFVGIFGLEVFSVRLVAAVIGCMIVLLTYLLGKNLFDTRTGIISSMLITVSPWHLFLSRFGHETITAPFFSALALLFLLKAIKTPKFLTYALLTLAISVYGYPVMKLYAPIVLLLYCLVFREQLKSVFSFAVANWGRALLLPSIIALPAYVFGIFQKGSKRFEEISVFSSENSFETFVSNYMEHLSPVFLFFAGDPRHGLSGMGLSMQVLLPFSVIAICYLLVMKSEKGVFLILLFATGFIPASLTMEGIPHAIRSTPAMPWLEILAAFGVSVVVRHLLKANISNWIQHFVLSVLLLLVGINASYTFYSYFVLKPYSTEYKYGIGEAIKYANKIQTDYDRIVISEESMDLATYAYPLFFAKLDPSDYQTNRLVGKYEIHENLNIAIHDENERVLYIVGPNSLPERSELKRFYGPDGTLLFRVLE